jgi:ATP-dependent Clp protease ATP-binding subunit ClpC
LAQDEARSLKHNYIGTEHILLGLLREEEGLAARVLDALGITMEETKHQIARIVGKGDEAHSGQVPFTPRAKKVLELSLREALSLGHNYIGTEHILLGLVRENEGVASRVLLDADVTAENVRNEVIRLLSVPRGKPVVTEGAAGTSNPSAGAVKFGQKDTSVVFMAELIRKLEEHGKALDKIRYETEITHLLIEARGLVQAATRYIESKTLTEDNNDN